MYYAQLGAVKTFILNIMLHHVFESSDHVLCSDLIRPYFVGQYSYLALGQWIYKDLSSTSIPDPSNTIPGIMHVCHFFKEPELCTGIDKDFGYGGRYAFD